MDVFTVVLLVWAVILFVLGPLFMWSLENEIKKDMKCAVEHKGLHKFIKSEQVVFSSCYGETTGEATFIILWCPRCRREIQTSWSDESWEAIPLAEV